MSDTHEAHDHDSHHSHAAPTVPETVVDEAGDSPTWLPMAGVFAAIVIVAAYFLAPHASKLFTQGRSDLVSTQKDPS